MNEELIKKVEELYNVNVECAQKIRNVYKVGTDKGNICIKFNNYDESRFKYILSGIVYLKKNGYNGVLYPIKNNKNSLYFEHDGKYAFVTNWIDQRHAEYDNESDLILATKSLASLHKAGKGYGMRTPYRKQRNYGKWILTFKKKIENIKKFKNIIEEKEEKSLFDKIYYDEIDRNIDIAHESIYLLRKYRYIDTIGRELRFAGMCHHDIANHNVLINDRGVYIIDFDYMILDSPLHDISSLLIRAMKDGKWSLNIAKTILKSYSEEKKLSKQDIKLIGAFIKFPQDFWQVGWQYYEEKQPFDEEIFLRKIYKYIKDLRNKENFIENFYKEDFEF